VAEPASTWTGAGSTGPATAAEAPASEGPAGRGETIDRETADARSAFHRAAQAEAQPVRRIAERRQRRSAALQTFFAANAGRSLLPASETTGSVSPAIKPEET
jgi:type IV secretion system protein TrbL